MKGNENEFLAAFLNVTLFSRFIWHFFLLSGKNLSWDNKLSYLLWSRMSFIYRCVLCDKYDGEYTPTPSPYHSEIKWHFFLAIFGIAVSFSNMFFVYLFCLIFRWHIFNTSRVWRKNVCSNNNHNNHNNVWYFICV